MQNSIIDELFILYETAGKLDILYKKQFGDILTDYGYTEMHCIDFIGKNENPNVTKIAQGMNLTKAGICKVIKRLTLKGAIETYRSSDNKKEIYYKLTKIGEEVFYKHLSMHELWCKKDSDFFSQFSQKDLGTVNEILSKYVKLLQTRLKDIEAER